MDKVSRVTIINQSIREMKEMNLRESVRAPREFDYRERIKEVKH